MPILDPFTIGGTAGLIAGLVVAVWGFATGRVVPGKRLDEALKLAELNANRAAEAVESVNKLTAAVDRLTRNVKAAKHV